MYICTPYISRIRCPQLLCPCYPGKQQVVTLKQVKNCCKLSGLWTRTRASTGESSTRVIPSRVFLEMNQALCFMQASFSDYLYVVIVKVTKYMQLNFSNNVMEHETHTCTCCNFLDLLFHIQIYYQFRLKHSLHKA